MKARFTLIALGILAIFTAQSQNFIDENKQWNVIYEAGMPDVTFTEIYTIEGDTIINNLTYYKLWVSMDSLATHYVKGFLREANNRVFYLPASGYTKNGTPGLLYDFNLQVGDTATIINEYGEVNMEVTSIDTIEYAGVARKRWRVKGVGSEPYPIDYWIEGIGSTNGITSSLFWEVIVCPSWMLSCYYEEGNLLYRNPQAPACYVEEGLDVDNSTDNVFVHLSPNPVQQGHSFYIANTLQAKNIAVYTMSGQLVKEASVYDNTKIAVSTQDMPKGLYLVRLTTKNNRILTSKLLVR